MKNELNEQILSMVRSRIPERDQIAPFLMNALFLGKEAVYRRIRGEVVFTFDEVVAISLKLGFSVDSLVGSKQSSRVFYDIVSHNNTLPEDTYYNTVLDYLNFFSKLCESKEAHARFAHNKIPFMLTVKYPTISKFSYYRWMHQSEGFDSDHKMAELIIPQKLKNLKDKWLEVKVKQNVHVTYMFDNNLFITMCRDIDFYYTNNLLNSEEVESLRSELLQMVDYIDLISSTGISSSGSPTHIYLIPFDLGANYMHFQYDNNTASQINIQSIDYLLSFNQNVCNMQKEWLDMIKRYSVFITQSGEMLRLAYFKKQRAHILNMGVKGDS